MSKLEERVLLYIALAVVCSVAGVFAGLPAAAAVFVQAAVLVEALLWLAAANRYRPREHRVLFTTQHVKGE